MKHYLGVDAGSSKTHALIVDESGVCVGFGKSSGGNHQRGGYAIRKKIIQTANELVK